jgi:alpha-methylacyl-CoA racemase
LEGKFFATLLRELGIPPVAFDPSDQYDEATWPRLRELLGSSFRTRTREEWTRQFEGTDACVTPVLSLREGAAHPHLIARRSILTDGDRLQPGAAPRFGATAVTTVPGRPPRPGEHTAEVLAPLAPAD